MGDTSRGHPPLNRRDRAILRACTHLPARLLAEPERFLLAAACVLIGVDTVFLGSPTSGLTAAPRLLIVEFGAAFLAGGATLLAGLCLNRLWLERLGQALTVIGIPFFLYAAIRYVGADAIPVTTIYAAISVTYGLRILKSARDRIHLHQQARLLR